MLRLSLFGLCGHQLIYNHSLTGNCSTALLNTGSRPHTGLGHNMIDPQPQGKSKIVRQESGLPLFYVPVVMRVHHTYPSCLE